MIALTRNTNGSWKEVLRYLEEIMIQSFPIGESMGFCTHHRNISFFAEDNSVCQYNLIQFKFPFCAFFLAILFSHLLFCLFLLLSSIPVLYSLLLPDTLENITLVAQVYWALKTETTPRLIYFIFHLAGQAFESKGEKKPKKTWLKTICYCFSQYCKVISVAR